MPVGVAIVVPGVVWPAVAGVVPVVVCPAVAGVVEVETLVWPAVAGAEVAPALPVVTVWANAHVPPNRRMKRSVFRMRNPPPPLRRLLIDFLDVTN